MESFDRSVAVLGILLVVGALLAGLAKRSLLSLSSLFVVVGFGLGNGGLGVLSFAPESGFVGALAVVALVLILFRDGLEVEADVPAVVELRDGGPSVMVRRSRA